MTIRFRLLTIFAVVMALSFLHTGYVAAGAWAKQFKADMSLLGADINEIIRIWGPPTSVYTSPNGERTFSWITVNGTTVTSEVSRELFSSSVNINSQSHENSCRKSFVVRGMVGTGIWLDPLKKQDFLVVAANSDTPAGQAGVEVGDVILAINGVSTKGMKDMKFDAVQMLVRGLLYDKGHLLERDETTLTLKRKKSKEPITVKIPLTGVVMKDRAISFNPQGMACYDY